MWRATLMTAVAASTAGLVAADFRFTKPALPDRAAAAPRADEQLAKDVRQELSEIEATHAAPESFARRATNAGVSDVQASVGKKFTDAALSFDSASRERTPEEEELESEMRAAMATPSHVGVPDRTLPTPATACSPDYSSCPVGWSKRGNLCVDAGSVKAKGCAARYSFGLMTNAQRAAVARECQLEFPCQAECDVNFLVTCPVLWEESVAGSICAAPASYVGDCSKVINVTGMGADEKMSLMFRCGVKWPCLETFDARAYNEICPEGWALGRGQTCHAPAGYAGPCEQIVRRFGRARFFMLGASAQVDMVEKTQANKAQMEYDCNVQWRSLGRKCTRDYNAACPAGWWQAAAGKGMADCWAPLEYRGTCSKRQSVSDVPRAKKELELNCEVQFPCVAGEKCVRDYSVPCPAAWAIVDGGRRCAAPAVYTGNCSALLDMGASLSAASKKEMEKVCGLRWPCAEELLFASVPREQERETPRPTVSLVDDGPVA
ncbi:unnamed protein product [Effrenium voratum]|nr:unnamed protein product [Effrenium voratum]